MRKPGIKFLILYFFLFVNCSLYAQSQGQFKVSDVVFEGNTTYADSRLHRLMLTKPSGFMHSSKFFQEVFEDDIQNILSFYLQNGYLDIKLVDTVLVRDSVDNKIDIKIILDEGLPTRVEGIAIFNNTVFTDSLLLTKINLKKNDPFKRNSIHDGMLSMLSMYADTGYLEAVITPEIKINAELHLALIDFRLEEKQQFTVGEIIMQDLEKTKRRVITRELLFAPGDIINYTRLLKSQRRLYLTGLFERVFIKTQKSSSADSTSKDIHIELKENLSSEFNVSVGYGSIDKLRGKMELFTTNIMGTARQAGIGLSASFIRRAVEVSFTEPWTLGTRWKTDLNLMYEYLEEPGYDISRIKGRLTIGRSFGQNSNAALTFRMENADLRNVIVSDITEQLDPRIRSFIIRIIHDTRDNYFDPTQGIYLEFTNEIAGAFLNGTNTFARSIGRVKYFHSLNRNTILGSAIEIGWMDFFGASDNIPLSERFYAGGPNSLRSFRYQSVGPLDREGDPLGGKFKIVWNVFEIRRAIYKLLGGAVFIDVGNIWPSINKFSIADIRASIGFGIRANTPLGIARFDIGFNPDKRGDENRSQFYFNMGHSF